MSNKCYFPHFSLPTSCVESAPHQVLTAGLPAKLAPQQLLTQQSTASWNTLDKDKFGVELNLLILCFLNFYCLIIFFLHMSLYFWLVYNEITSAHHHNSTVNPKQRTFQQYPLFSSLPWPLKWLLSTKPEPWQNSRWLESKAKEFPFFDISPTAVGLPRMRILTPATTLSALDLQVDSKADCNLAHQV